jgi:hypothetical protein
VVAVNGEDGNAHVVIGILVVDHAEPVRAGSVGLNAKGKALKKKKKKQKKQRTYEV